MIINKTSTEDFQEVRSFYHSLIDSFQNLPYHPMWKKDIYPSTDDIQIAIEEGTLFLGLVDSRIVGAMVVNQKCNESYQKATWLTELEQDAFMVIHMLGVHSDFAGRGFAGELVTYAIKHAREAGMKAIRIDVLEGNLPANQLYEAFDFQYVDTVSMFYEDTGWEKFRLYELML